MTMKKIYNILLLLHAPSLIRKFILTTKYFLLILLSFYLNDSYSATLNVPGTYANIQAGLNAAASGDVVLVASGTYVENLTWPSVQGITLLSVSGPSNTIIDGGSANRVITFPTGQNFTNTTIIEGFTVQNGLLTASTSHGAGIYAKDCSAILRNLIIKDNTITGAGWAFGGGVYAENSPTLLVENCTFENNEVNSTDWSYGAGIYYESSTDASISNCTFTGNRGIGSGGSARAYGGAIYSDGCDLNIEDVLITDTYMNTDKYINGGALFMNGGTCTLNNVQIERTITTANSGRVYGGGIYYKDGGVSTWNNIIVNDQDIQADNYIWGGAIYLNNSSPTINNCTFSNSHCTSSGERVYGGGVYVSGGDPNFNKVNMTCNETFSTSYNYGAGFYITKSGFFGSATVGLTNALVAHNVMSNTGSFTSGAGIYVATGTVLNATNVTVTENSRDAGTTNGVGLFNGGTVNIVNSIFWNDYPGTEFSGSGNFSVDYSDVRGGYAGTGNINSLPLFVASGTDYHLQSGLSPCEDMGNAGGAPTDDLDGSGRPAGGGYDMGAFETQAYINKDFCPFLITLPLPVELVKFEGYNYKNDNKLIWTTATEINNDYFIVQKSADAKNYTDVGIVNGHGNSNIALEYEFIDESSSFDVTYYRLKQIDFDGKYAFSKIVWIKSNREIDIKIYPNPSKENFSFDLNESTNEVYTIIYTNITGEAHREKINISEGINTYQVNDFKDLARGIYFVQILSEKGERFKAQRIIKMD